METLPPNPDSETRQAVNRWSTMWDRPVGKDVYSPNYARWLGQMVAGLMSAKPPTAEGLVNLDETDGFLSELVEESSETAAAVGCALLRPANTGEQWVAQVLPPTRAELRWMHRRLAEAWLWTLYPHPDRNRKGESRWRVALVEHWLEEGGVEFLVAEGEYDEHQGVFRAGGNTPPDEWWTLDTAPDNLTALPALQAYKVDQEALSGEDVRLSCFAWKWVRNMPAPIYATNEQLVTGLERLWDQEQVDAEMVKNRIALPSRSLGRDVVRDASGAPIAQPGWNMDSNLLLLDTPGAVSEGDIPFHLVQFDDHLIQRERIERRENALLEAVGINPQSVGRSVAGRSDSAAAKRADQQMTLNTVSSPAMRLQRALSDVLTVVNNLNGTRADVDVTITAGPKPVASESAETARTLAAAGAASTETLIRTAHPEWSDEQVEDELNRMASEGAVALPAEGGPDILSESFGDGFGNVASLMR